MAYCGPRGIPESTFLGSPTPGVWTDTDRLAALEWQLWESRRCPSCGTHAEDWDPELGGQRHAYSARLHECEGCVRIEQVGRTEESKRPGMRIRVTKAGGGCGAEQGD